MWSTTAWTGVAPADLDLDLVADAVAILEVDREAGEVVVDLVLAADRHGGAEEPGARQEEGGIDVEQVEADDRDHDPHHERDQVVQHPRRGIDALTPAVLAHLERLATDSPRTVAPPARRCGDAAGGDPAHDAADHETAHPCEDQAAEHEHGDDQRPRHRGSVDGAVGRGSDEARGDGRRRGPSLSVCHRPPDYDDQVTKVALAAGSAASSISA